MKKTLVSAILVALLFAVSSGAQTQSQCDPDYGVEDCGGCVNNENLGSAVLAVNEGVVPGVLEGECAGCKFILLITVEFDPTRTSGLNNLSAKAGRHKSGDFVPGEHTEVTTLSGNELQATYSQDLSCRVGEDTSTCVSMFFQYQEWPLALNSASYCYTLKCRECD